jgi:hypothetical protein
VFVFASKLPLKTVDNTFDASLQNVNGNADGSPPLAAVGKNSQYSDQRGGALFILILGRAV